MGGISEWVHGHVEWVDLLIVRQSMIGLSIERILTAHGEHANPSSMIYLQIT